MPIVTVRAKEPAPITHRKINVILPGVDTGASPYGSTNYKMLMACPREYALTKIALLRKTALDVPLTTGWMWHYCLQRFYETILQHQKKSNAPTTSDEFAFAGQKEAMVAAYDAMKPFENEPGYEDCVNDVQRMLDGYFERYNGVDRLRILAIEETLTYQGSFQYSARLDLLVEDLSRGGMYVYEHKSARAITADLLNNYQLDLQILGQVFLLLKCVDLKRYPPFRGVRINIATKHKTPQFERVDVLPSNRHIEALKSSVTAWSALRKTYEKLGWPQALGHCAGFSRGYKSCKFFDLCHGHPTLSVDYWTKNEPPFGFERGAVLTDHNISE